MTKKMMLVAAAALLASGGPVLAQAEPATPGERGHVLKMTRHLIRLGTTRDAEVRADLFLSGAGERVRELEAMHAKGKTSHDEAFARSYEKHVKGGATEIELGAATGRDMTGVVGRYAEATSKHLAVLQGLLDKVPPQGRKGIMRALEASRHGHEQAIAAHQRGKKKVSQGQPGREKVKSDDDPKGPKAGHKDPSDKADRPGKGRPDDQEDAGGKDKGKKGGKDRDDDRPGPRDEKDNGGHGPPPGKGKGEK